MAFRRRKPELSREQSLASVPLRNTAVREEETDEGFVRLVIPRRDSRWVRCMAGADAWKASPVQTLALSSQDIPEVSARRFRL